MDWFAYIRENIWLAIVFAAILTSVVTAFANLFEKVQGVPNTKLNILFSIIIGLAVTNLNLDWHKLTSYQDTAIRLSLTIFLPYLVAKVRGQELVDNLISGVVEGAKNFKVGKKGDE